MCHDFTSSREEHDRGTHYLDAADETITNLALWMQSHGRGEAVVTRSQQDTPGFGPQISKSHLENAARKRGMFIHYKSFEPSDHKHGGSPAYYVFLSTAASLSDHDAASVVESHNQLKEKE